MTKIALEPSKVETLTMAACALHNFMVDRQQICSNVTRDDPNTEDAVGLGNLAVAGRPSMESARAVRDSFCQYLNNEGAVTWQEQMI